MESARASRAGSSKCRRGWLGLGRISSSGMSRRPAAWSRPAVGMMAARPRPRPERLAASATGGHLLRKLEIGHRARATRVVAGDREPVARRLAHADVARDDRVEDEL